MKHVTSRRHPIVADCRALARGRGDLPDRVLLDGIHLVEEAVKAGLLVETAAIDEAMLARPEGSALANALTEAGADVVSVTRPVLEALSPVTTPSGIVAIAHRPGYSLEAVLSHPPQLAVVGVDIQDPGNLGAIARTAEAAGATGLVLCGASADPFGWKALRGSMGSLLRLPAVARIPWPEAVAAARAAGVAVVATLPRGGKPPDETDLTGPVAFLLGGEGPGLPPEAAAAADVAVSILMRPQVESLNVSVAAALLVYEAARQRKTKGGPSGPP